MDRVIELVHCVLPLVTHTVVFDDAQHPGRVCFVGTAMGFVSVCLYYACYNLSMDILSHP